MKETAQSLDFLIFHSIKARNLFFFKFLAGKNSIFYLVDAAAAEQQLLVFRCVREMPLVSSHLIWPPRRMTPELKSKSNKGELEGRGSISHLTACKRASSGSSYIYSVAL